MSLISAMWGAGTFAGPALGGTFAEIEQWAAVRAPRGSGHASGTARTRTGRLTCASGAGAPKANFREQCVIAAAMRTAEVAWRRALTTQTLADIRAGADRGTPHAVGMMRSWYATR